MYFLRHPKRLPTSLRKSHVIHNLFCLLTITGINNYLGLGDKMVRLVADFYHRRLIQIRNNNRITLTRSSKIIGAFLRGWASLTVIKIWRLWVWSNPTSGDRAIFGGIMFDSTTADYEAAGRRYMQETVFLNRPYPPPILTIRFLA